MYTVVILLIAFSIVFGETGRFIALSDIHYSPFLNRQNPSIGDVKYGQDSPLWLMNSSIFAAAAALPNPDFIVITGDLHGHDLSNLNPTEASAYQKQVLGDVSSTFAAAFANSPIFSKYPLLSLGNNDLYPKYAAPGTTVQWLSNFESLWPSFNMSRSSTFPNTGCLRNEVKVGNNTLRILSVHTNYVSASNEHTSQNPDPAGIFQWLSDELKSAQAASIKVYILGHIPPGIDHFSNVPLWYENLESTYISVTNPYLQNTIAGQFFGHEHIMLFRLYGDLTTSIPIQLHSSISPIYNNNPSFRIYTYDKNSFEISDYEQWYLQLSPPNPTWNLQYSSFKSIFEVPALSSVSLCNLVDRLVYDDDLFQKMAQNSESFSPYFNSCTGACMKRFLCNAINLFKKDFDDCFSSNQIRCNTSSGPTTQFSGSVSSGATVSSSESVSTTISPIASSSGIGVRQKIIFGIGVGVAVLVLLGIGVAVYFFIRRRWKARQTYAQLMDEQF